MSTYKLPRHGDEEWRPAKLLNHQTQILEDLPDYFASNIGRICHKSRGKYRIVKQSKDKDGYLICYIGKRRCKAHRIIASTFLEIPKDIKEPIVDHISGIKTDNKVGNPYHEEEEKRGNLRWVSIQENTLAAHKNKQVGPRRMLKVLAVDENEDAVLYRNQRIASEETGVDARSVSQVVRGLNRSASGYRFVRINHFEDRS